MCNGTPITPTTKSEPTAHERAVEALENAISFTSLDFLAAAGTPTPKHIAAPNNRSLVGEKDEEREVHVTLKSEVQRLRNQNQRVTRVMTSYGKRVNELEAQVKIQAITKKITTPISPDTVQAAWDSLVPDLGDIIEDGVTEALEDIDFSSEIERMVGIVAESTDIEGMVRNELDKIVQNGYTSDSSGWTDSGEEDEGEEDKPYTASEFSNVVESEVARVMATGSIESLVNLEVARAGVIDIHSLVEAELAKAFDHAAENAAFGTGGDLESDIYNSDFEEEEFDDELPVPASPVESISFPLSSRWYGQKKENDIQENDKENKLQENDEVFARQPPPMPKGRPLLAVERRPTGRLPLIELTSDDSPMPMPTQSCTPDIPDAATATSTRIETAHGSHVTTIVTSTSASRYSYSCDRPLILAAPAPDMIEDESESEDESEYMQVAPLPARLLRVPANPVHLGAFLAALREVDERLQMHEEEEQKVEMEDYEVDNDEIEIEVGEEAKVELENDGNANVHKAFVEASALVHVAWQDGDCTDDDEQTDFDASELILRQLDIPSEIEDGTDRMDFQSTLPYNRFDSIPYDRAEVDSPPATATPTSTASTATAATASAAGIATHPRVLELQQALRDTEQQRDLAMALVSKQGARWSSLIGGMTDSIDGPVAQNISPTLTRGSLLRESDDIVRAGSAVSSDGEELSPEQGVRWSWSELEMKSSPEATRNDTDTSVDVADMATTPDQIRTRLIPIPTAQKKQQTRRVNENGDVVAAASSLISTAREKHATSRGLELYDTPTLARP